MIFINLTKLNTGEELIVNAERIEVLTAHGDNNTKLHFSQSEASLFVEESPKTIVKTIQNRNRNYD